MPQLRFSVPYKCTEGKGLCLQPVSLEVLPVLKMTAMHLPVKGMQAWRGATECGAIHIPSGTLYGLVLLTKVACFGCGFSDRAKEMLTDTLPLSRGPWVL